MSDPCVCVCLFCFVVFFFLGCTAGFPIRRVFDEFLQRYGAISPSASNIDALLADLVEKVRRGHGDETTRGLVYVTVIRERVLNEEGWACK